MHSRAHSPLACCSRCCKAPSTRSGARQTSTLAVDWWPAVVGKADVCTVRSCLSHISFNTAAGQSIFRTKGGGHQLCEGEARAANHWLPSTFVLRKAVPASLSTQQSLRCLFVSLLTVSMRHVAPCAAIREAAEEGATDRQDHHAVEREVSTGCLALPFIATVKCHRPAPDNDDAFLQCAHASGHPAGPQAIDPAPSGRLPTAAEARPASEQAVAVRGLNLIHAILDRWSFWAWRLLTLL
jgi:hypothetical protein